MTPGCRVDRLADLLQAGLPYRHQHPPLVPEVKADLVVGLEGCQQFVKSVVQVGLFAFNKSISPRTSFISANLTGSDWGLLAGVQLGLLEENKPDVHPGGLGGGGEEDVHHPQGGDVRLAGDGRLDGVLGRHEAELDQLAVAHLQSS